jgi:hypothetical protein
MADSSSTEKSARIFVIYKHKVEPDQTVVNQVVAALVDTSFRLDFFSMLRSWHNSRANITTSIWKQLDLVLVTSTEPYQLIENLN